MRCRDCEHVKHKLTTKGFETRLLYTCFAERRPFLVAPDGLACRGGNYALRKHADPDKPELKLED